MIQFPELPIPDYRLSVEREDNLIRSKFEKGNVLTRVKYTRQRKKFTSVRWNSMKEEDWRVLEAFYEETTRFGSLLFEWIHPLSKKVFVVRFSGPPKDSLILVNRYYIEIGLEEV